MPFTAHLEEIQNRLTFTQSKGRTALLDAIYLALHEMKKAKNPRKALLMISDGGDNNSRYTENEIKNLVREADVQIYAIGIYEPVGARGRTAEEMAGPGLLSEIAEQTGGRHFPVENLNELPDIAAKIGIELRNQYMLGYAPSQPGPRRQVPPGPGEAGAAAGTAASPGLLENGLLCANSIKANSSCLCSGRRGLGLWAQQRRHASRRGHRHGVPHRHPAGGAARDGGRQERPPRHQSAAERLSGLRERRRSRRSRSSGARTCRCRWG